MSTTPMSLAQFGQTIKAKHPEYNDLADEDLGQKVLAKYPQYSDMVQQAPKSAVPQQMLDTLKRNINSRAGGMGQTTLDKTSGIDNVLTFGKNLLGFAAGAGQALEGPSGMGRTIAGLSEGVTAGAMATPQNASLPEKAAMVAGPALGINTPALASAAKNRDFGAMLAEAGPALGASLAPAALRGIKGNGPEPIPSMPEPPARTIMKSIGPREMDMQPLQEAIDAQHGNITQFAQQNKMPLNTRLDYASAARAYAETQKGFYESQILNPVADSTVNAPQGFKGYTTGEANNWTTIGSLEQRLRAINAEQNSIHNSPTEALTREALAKDAELSAEAASVRGTLYQEIGKRTNLTPEQVQQIRQQFGAPQTIADMTTRAVNRETAMETRQDRGTTTVPDGRMGIMNWAVNRYRGGAVAIGDRNFQSALQAAPMPAAQALQPQVLPQQSYPYQSAWGDTTGPQVPSIFDQSLPPQGSTEGIQSALANRGGKASTRAASANSAQELLANRLAARRMIQNTSRKP